MEKAKTWIGKLGGEKLRGLVIWFLKVTGLGNQIVLFSTNKAKKNKVNINYWSGAKNLGDAVSPVIVQNVAQWKNVNIDKSVEKTKHLYAVGSVITAGCQDCTIWGSGLLNAKILSRLKGRELDVRSVRGPLTRLILMEFGFDVPKNYGDPAILMPLIYNPNVEKKYKVSVITHMNEPLAMENGDIHKISIMTDDYEWFVREIKSSELVISSSLHGIIFAETYGVPAVLLKPNVDLLKYYDFYYSTGRYNFPIVETVADGLCVKPAEIPDYTEMRKRIIDAFPTDLWN